MMGKNRAPDPNERFDHWWQVEKDRGKTPAELKAERDRTQSEHTRRTDVNHPDRR